jgi:hypothetical protein
VGHLFYEYASTIVNMIWDIEFYNPNLDPNSEPVHTEMIFAPGVKECQEEAKLILKRIKKDVELTFHIREVVIDETC